MQHCRSADRQIVRVSNSPHLGIRWNAGGIALALWAVAVVCGMGWLVRYQMSATAATPTAPAQWPVAARIARAADRPTLVMALHPDCPCSRASVNELSVLLAQARQKPAVQVIVCRPDGAPAGWEDSDLVRSARAIPGVTVSIDNGGADAAAFGATTSGQVVLCDAQGHVLFSGGITDGRGHEGDNPGLDAALAALGEPNSTSPAATPAMRTTPVYGCPLMNGRSNGANCSGSPVRTGKDAL
jgi:hypothetical protein